MARIKLIKTILDLIINKFHSSRLYKALVFHVYLIFNNFIIYFFSLGVHINSLRFNNAFISKQTD